jgi:hypothetical protein
MTTIEGNYDITNTTTEVFAAVWNLPARVERGHKVTRYRSSFLNQLEVKNGGRL